MIYCTYKKIFDDIVPFPSIPPYVETNIEYQWWDRFFSFFQGVGAAAV